jgi:hypothetical protein
MRSLKNITSRKRNQIVHRRLGEEIKINYTIDKTLKYKDGLERAVFGGNILDENKLKY